MGDTYMNQNLLFSADPSFDLAPNPCAGRDPVAVQSEFTLSNVEGSGAKPPRRMSGGNINQKTKKMQNKPNSCRGVASAKTDLNPYFARRYKNFTRHSVSEGGPIQTQSNPKTKPFFVPKTPIKAKTNPTCPCAGRDPVVVQCCPLPSEALAKTGKPNPPRTRRSRLKDLIFAVAAERGLNVGWLSRVKIFRESKMKTFKVLIPVLVTAGVLFGAEQSEDGKENEMNINLQWLGHASFKIWTQESVVYIDPWKLKETGEKADVVLVSHGHFDHYSAQDLKKIAGEKTKLISSADVIEKEKTGQVLEPGKTIEAGEVKVTGVAAYNPKKQFHPKENKWLGFVLEVESVKIYYAGDTDLTDQMKGLEGIDVALLPVGGTYTMDAKAAAEAVKHIKPKAAVPYHWGDIVGEQSDAKRFSDLADCKVIVLQAGQSMTLSDILE
jgi:L-ascorbate metabolism protein UlaG (beta-lactamase superfamily)